MQNISCSVCGSQKKSGTPCIVIILASLFLTSVVGAAQSVIPSETVSPPISVNFDTNANVAEWRQFRFENDHSGVNPYETVLNATTVGQLTIDWSFATPAALDSSAAVVNGVVYFSDQVGNFWALDASTGGVLWKAGGNEGSGATSPAVVSGVAYFGAGRQGSSSGCR